jgi:putative flippase GtrA
LIPGSLIKFLLVGILNTALGLSVIFAVQQFTTLSDIAANMIGYALGLTMSFCLNKRWTFGFRGEQAASLLRFLGVFAIAYCANLATVIGLKATATLNPLWNQALGVIPYTALFYVGSRCYVFPRDKSISKTKR